MPRPFSAVVSAWNCEKTIHRCLRSVTELKPQDTIVCDLGSTDSTTGIIAADFEDATILPFGNIKSFAVARNAGLARARGAFVLFVDGDWIANGPSVDRLICELE